MIESADITVGELVRRIGRGEIRLPELQRQYTWDKTRVRDLLDSLYRDYPSGSILTWKTDEDVATGQFAVNQDVTDTMDYELLLDGQQRLTSLKAVLNGEPVRVKGRKNPIEIDILFNLNHPDESSDMNDTQFDDDNDDEDADLDELEDDALGDEATGEDAHLAEHMTFVVASRKFANSRCMVSVSKVFKEGIENTLKDAGISSNDPKFFKYIGRLEDLQRIKDRKFRVITLPRDLSYERVTDVFVRVNSRGVHLKASDLALAQITSKWPGSSKEFYEFDSDCKEHFGFDLGLPIHLKNLVSLATKQSRFKVVSGLPQEVLKEAWGDAREGMQFALNYLCETMRINNTAYLSSPFIIVALAALGKQLKNQQAGSAREFDPQLRRWVLTANAKGRYSRGSTETLLDEDLKSIYNSEGIEQLLEQLFRHIVQQVGRLKIEPGDLSGRSQKSPLFKTMFLAFREAKASDWGKSGLIISLKNVGVKHKIQGHHIFPRAIMDDEPYAPININEICNMAFVCGEKNREMSKKPPIETLSKISKEELSKQCIPTDEALWSIDRFNDFLEARRELVAKRLSEYIDHG